MKRDSYVLTIENTGATLVHPDRRFARFIKALGRRYGWKVSNIRYAKPLFEQKINENDKPNASQG